MSFQKVLLRQLAACLIGAAGMLSLNAPAFADTVSLECVKDTSIFTSSIGDPRSDGAGVFLWCGRTGTNSGTPYTSRALFLFDLSSIPAGSTVTAARFKLRLEAAAPSSGTQTSTVHKMLSSWGESTSDAFGGSGAPAELGDATWLSRFWPDDPWTTPGGDFVSTASASLGISGSTFTPTFSGAGMVADVQSWIADPATNHGWVLRGNESVNKTARKFSSRHISVATSRPRLEVDFTPPPPCIADFNSVGGATVQDIFDYLAAWFSNCTAAGAPPCIRSADVNTSGTITVQDIFDFLAAWFTGC